MEINAYHFRTRPLNASPNVLVQTTAKTKKKKKKRKKKMDL